MAQRAVDQQSPPPTSAPAPDSLLGTWKDRLHQSAQARRRYEHDWQLAAAFLQNRQWLGWVGTGRSRRLVELPNPQRRVRYTVNVLTGYYSRFQGKLLADDARPDVTFRRSDIDGESKDFADQSRRTLEYAWDDEAEADEAYELASAKRLTYGLGFIRVRYDPLAGPLLTGPPSPAVNGGQPQPGAPIDFPLGPDGMPITDPSLAMPFVEQAFQSGEPVEWRQLREGKVKLEPGGPFELFPPPGVRHEKLFPWLIVGRPVPLNEVKGIYSKAVKLGAERLRVTDTVGLRSDDGRPSPEAELKEHVMLYTGYEFPCPDYPLGREYVWASDTELDQAEQLPLIVKGEGKAGIVFFKFREVEGRWWPLGLIEPGIGAQRQINHSRSQTQEIKDRVGMPRTYAVDGAITEANRPKGMIGEIVNVRPGFFEQVKEVQGTPPGPWVQAEADVTQRDMDTVMTLRADASAAPAGVTAYSAYAHFNEQEDQAIGPIRRQDRRALREVAFYMLHIIRRYWPHEKRIAVAGEDGLRDEFVFQAAKLPEEMYVEISDSAPAPQSQAAKIQLTMDLYDRSISSGQTLPLSWLYDSLMEGKPLPLPVNEMQTQQELAQFENLLMGQGQQIVPQPYHNHQLHIAQHRAAQAAYANLPGYEQVVQLLEMHIQEHMQMAAASAAQVPPGQAGVSPGAQGGQAAGIGPLAATMAAQPR